MWPRGGGTAFWLPRHGLSNARTAAAGRATCSIVSASMAEHVLQVCPTAEASWYDGVGHMPFTEDAGRFNRELAQLARGAVR